MALTHRFTTAGKAKQLADERAAWTALAAAAVGTPLHAQILAIGAWNIAGACTNVNTAHVNYPDWLRAHQLFTKRARRERQRTQTAQALNGGLPNHPIPLAHLPCQVLPVLNVRDTLRAAIMHTGTREGGATRITPGGAHNGTTAQLLTHLKKQLKKIENELADVATHREQHDLRSAGHPPLQVFLATEWYFRPAGRPHTAAEKANIIVQLQALSRRFPDWLIVPGSIYWSPDPLANATVRVFNTTLALWAGSVLCERRKCESHDIDGADTHHERWGPDSAAPLAGIPAASAQPGFFTLNGREFCLEICRDHSVGDAVEGYLNAVGGPLPGAHVYLFTSNGTVIAPGFLPVQDNGLVLFCDGSGGGAQQYLRVNRVNPLNHAGNLVPFGNYRGAFVPERIGYSVASDHLDDATAIEHANAAPFAAFMLRYNALYGNPSSDAVLQGIINVAVGLIAPAPNGAGMMPWQKGLRIQRILAGGVLPTGVAIPAAQVLAMTPYANHLVLGGAGVSAAFANGVAVTGPARGVALAQFAVVTAAATGVTAAIPGAVADLRVYALVDL